MEDDRQMGCCSNPDDLGTTYNWNAGQFLLDIGRNIQEDSCLRIVALRTCDLTQGMCP
jgi:hypothetical protein